MILPSFSARAERQGGRWSTPKLISELAHLAAIERGVAHVVAAWVPKVPELNDKLELAACFEEGMARAVALRHHQLSLLEQESAQLLGNPDWIQPLRDLDDSGDWRAVVTGILGDARQFLLERYGHLKLRLDPLLDARLLTLVGTAIDRLTASTSAIGTPVRPAEPSGHVKRALASAAQNLPGSGSPLDQLLWLPLDRVPVPARPAGRDRPITGSRSHVRRRSRRTAEDLGGELNDNVMAELSALELLCRCSYEHPEQPWSFHLALARHATDEARHAAIFRRLLVENGIDETTLPQHGANYEHGYEFPECKPNSERELVWRLLILATVLEALAVDKLPVEIGGRDFLGQAAFARALDYISVDELLHVENGLRLTRQLCTELKLDPLLERERVHGRFFGRQRDIRLKYLQSDPTRAAAEIALLQDPDPDGILYASRTEIERRLRASFTIDECKQVERWGYNPIRHQGFEAASKNADVNPVLRQKSIPSRTRP